MIDDQVRQILSSCVTSTRMVAKTFFPERFSLPFSPVIHNPIFDLIDGPDQLIAIAAPRGYGKTSIDALALPARHIAFRLTDFIVYINKSFDAASLQTENLRRELITNRVVKSIFGPVRTKDASNEGFDESFSKKSWVAYNTLVWPRGAGQQVRGVLFKNSRPGLIIIDDLEDSESVENKEYRDKLFQWLYADVLKCVPRMGPLAKSWKIIYIDTLKHEDSVLQRLLDSPEWKSVRLEACDDDFKSTAPDFISDEDIAKEWQKHVDSGQTDVFFRELRNLPISTKDSAFQQQYFRYYNLPPNRTPRKDIDLAMVDAELQNGRDCETVIIVDPAKTVKMNSAESAVIGMGINLTSAHLYVRDAIAEKVMPNELYDIVFDMAIRLGAKVIGIETTGLEEFIKQPFKNEMFRRGKFFELIWLKARGGSNDEKGKILRIRELVPYYRLGYIYHNAVCPAVKKLEQQLLKFPRSKLLDLMDVEAYIIEMLELGERYFSPIQNPEDLESEYSELDYEIPLKDWRCA
jgi:predicted phage terminase large subunit-like protein